MKYKKVYISILLLICIITSSCSVNKPKKKSIRILTQNVCMQSSVLATDYAEKGWTSKVKSDTKLSYTFNLIKEYDFVAFQEANDEYSVDELVRKWYTELKKKYQKIDFSQPLLFQKSTDVKSNQVQIVSGDYFVLGPDLENAKYTGGLLILSKYQIIESGGLVFENYVGLAASKPDGFFNKGIIYARIQIEDDYIHVFNTHLQSGKSSAKDITEYFKLKKEYENKNTDKKTKESIKINPIYVINETRRKQLKQVKDFIKDKTKDDNLNRPILVLGDFNIDNQSKYIIEKIGGGNITFVDTNKSNPVTWLGNDHTGEKSKDTPWGKLGNQLANEAGEGESIDYIFYSSKKESPNAQTFIKISKTNTVPAKPPSKPYCFPITKTEVLTEKINGDLKKAIEKKFIINKNNVLKDVIFKLGGKGGLEKKDIDKLNSIMKKGFGDAEWEEITKEAKITRSGSNFILRKTPSDKKVYVLRIRAKEPVTTENLTYGILWSSPLKNDVITIYRYTESTNDCKKKTECGKIEEYSTISDHLGLEIEFDFYYKKPPSKTPTPSLISTLPPQETSTPFPSDDVAAIPEAEESPEAVETILLSAQGLIDEGLEHLAKADDYYEEHDCENWIPESEVAFNKCTTAAEHFELLVDEAGIIPIYYYIHVEYCLGKALFGLGNVPEGIKHFEQALERGLSGERQKAVNEVVEGNKAWLEYEPCAISEIWFEECGQLTTDELNANWKFIEECNNPHLIVWEHNNKVYCHHKIPADEHENVDGSMIFDDAGGNIKSGVWKVKVLDVGRKIGEATCNVP